MTIPDVDFVILPLGIETEMDYIISYYVPLQVVQRNIRMRSMPKEREEV